MHGEMDDPYLVTFEMRFWEQFVLKHGSGEVREQLLWRLVLQLGHGGSARLVVALHQKLDHRVTRHVAEA